MSSSNSVTDISEDTKKISNESKKRGNFDGAELMRCQSFLLLETGGGRWKLLKKGRKYTDFADKRKYYKDSRITKK